MANSSVDDHKSKFKIVCTALDFDATCFILPPPVSLAISGEVSERSSALQRDDRKRCGKDDTAVTPPPPLPIHLTGETISQKNTQASIIGGHLIEASARCAGAAANTVDANTVRVPDSTHA